MIEIIAFVIHNKFTGQLFMFKKWRENHFRLIKLKLTYIVDMGIILVTKRLKAHY